MSEDDLKILVKLIAPFAPYMAEELWAIVGSQCIATVQKESVHAAAWPEVEKEYLLDDKVKIAVAVNGKVRSELEVDSDRLDNQQEVLGIAKANGKIKQWIDGKEVVKEIYIKGKMVNLVVK